MSQHVGFTSLIIVTLMAAPTADDHPSTRRLIIAANPDTRVEARAHVGEGIIDLTITRPDPTTRRNLEAQVADIVERFETYQDDADVMRGRLFTSVAYPQVTVLSPSKQRRFIDVTVHPQALPPKEPILPSVLAIAIHAEPLPLPAREFRATSGPGRGVIDALEAGHLRDARFGAKRAIERDEPATFETEVLTEVYARQAFAGQIDKGLTFDAIPLPKSTAGRLTWIAAALHHDALSEADEALQAIEERGSGDQRAFIALYRAIIDHKLGKPAPTVSALRAVVSSGARLGPAFTERATIVLASALLARGDITGADALLGSVKTPKAGLWRAELAYLAGNDAGAKAAFNKLLNDETYGAVAKLRQVDLGVHTTQAQAEAVLSALNSRAEGDEAAMLARARLLERGLLTKTFDSTLSSLGHLAATDLSPVAMDAELRIGRLMSRAGRPDAALRALLRAASHAHDRVSRDRIRERSNAAFLAGVDQYERWGRYGDLLAFAEEFEAVIDSHPETARIMTSVAGAARRTGATSVAVKYLVKVAASSDKNIRQHILAELVNTYMQAGDYARAKTVLSYADETGVTVASAALSRAKADVARHSGQPQQAIDAYVLAAGLAKTATERTESLALAAAVALEHDNTSDAKSVLERMLKSERPGIARGNDARIDLATIHLREGRATPAIELLSRVRTSSVADRTPDDVVAQVVFFEGEARMRAGDPDGALAVWTSRDGGDSEWDALSRLASTAAKTAKGNE